MAEFIRITTLFFRHRGQFLCPWRDTRTVPSVFLEVDPAELINASVFPDRVLKKKPERSV